MLARFDALTATALAGLTSDQVQHYIDVEIALAKIIPVMPPEGDEPTKPNLEATETAYEFGGLLFKSHADAEAVTAMELLESEYDYRGPGYDYKWLKLRTDRTVRAAQYPTERAVRALTAELTAYKEAKNAWEAQCSAYQKFQDQTSACRAHVYTAVSNAKAWLRSVTAAKAVYEKYIRLAGGDTQAARRLFHDAYASEADGIYNAVAASQGFADWQPPQETSNAPES